MQVNNTPQVNTSQNAGEAGTQVKRASQEKPQTNTPIKITDTQSARSIPSLISSAGLPQDKLSATIISLARFFSLSFKPEKLALIRRQAFMQQASQKTTPSAPQTAQSAAIARETALPANIREALPLTDARAAKSALAAAAAESKGAELQPKALELFTEAVDPDSGRQDHDGQEKKDREQKEQEKPEKTNAVNPDSVKKLALKSAEENLVLSILNRLPSKDGNGQLTARWIVLPFEFDQDGKNFRVSLRVLMEHGSAGFAVLDIVTGGRDQGSGIREDHRQAFALEFANGRVNKVIHYKSGNTNNLQDSIKKELAKLFEIPVENVFIKTEYSLPEADYGEQLLSFIDEAV